MPYVPNRRKRSFKRKRNQTKLLREQTYIQRTTDGAPQNQMSRYFTDFNPFPAVHYATLRYVTKIALTPPSPSQAATHFFRANSIHDPDYSGLTFGGQPYGHDTYMSIYNHYQVLRSTITVQGNPSTNQPSPGIGIMLNDDSNVIEDEARQLCAMKGSSYMMQGMINTVTVKRSFNTKYMQNKHTQCAPFGSDVADPMFFVVFSMDDSDTTKILYAYVTINYHVRMWELRDLSST